MALCGPSCTTSSSKPSTRATPQRRRGAPRARRALPRSAASGRQAGADGSAPGSSGREHADGGAGHGGRGAPSILLPTAVGVVAALSVASRAGVFDDGAALAAAGAGAARLAASGDAVVARALEKAFRGGTAGAAAMALNVLGLMWMRTTVNFQVRARRHAHCGAAGGAPPFVPRPSAGGDGD